MISNARFAVAGRTVDIGSHQWDFTDEVRYPELTTAIGPYGAIFRRKTGTSYRTREARFVKTDVLMDAFRQVAIWAGLTGEPVTFTPDLDVPAETWVVDWPTELEFQRVVENREEIRFLLVEQG